MHDRQSHVEKQGCLVLRFRSHHDSWLLKSPLLAMVMRKILKISESQNRIPWFLSHQAPFCLIGTRPGKGVYRRGSSWCRLCALGLAKNVTRCRDHSQVMDKKTEAQIYSAICSKSHNFPVIGMEFEPNSVLQPSRSSHWTRILIIQPSSPQTYITVSSEKKGQQVFCENFSLFATSKLIVSEIGTHGGGPVILFLYPKLTVSHPRTSSLASKNIWAGG